MDILDLQPMFLQCYNQQLPEIFQHQLTSQTLSRGEDEDEENWEDYGKPDGRAQKFVRGDRFISNDPRNCNLFLNLNNIHA